MSAPDAKPSDAARAPRSPTVPAETRSGPLFAGPRSPFPGAGSKPGTFGPLVTTLSGSGSLAVPTVQIEGIVSRVVFTAEDDEFAVLQIDLTAPPLHSGQSGPLLASASPPPSVRGPITAVGQLSGIVPGETLRILGVFETHAQYGRRLRAHQALPIGPQTRLGMERYLATLSGIGPELARRVVEQLGLDSLDVLEAETWRVAQIKGVGKRRAQRALIDARARREERAVMVFLQGLGVSAAYAARIRKKYGQTAITQVKQNPYALARDVTGIGFQIADRIAQAVGIDPSSPLRIAAGLRHVLDTAGDAGHCFLPAPELFERTMQLLRSTLPPVPEGAQVEAGPATGPAASATELDVTPQLWPALEDLIEQKAALIDREVMPGEEPARSGERVYLTRMYQAEVELARILVRLSLARRARVPTVRTDLGAVRLAPGQQAALRQVEDGPVCVITGGPGTGKTTIIRALVASYAAAGLRIKLVAPTGRAAKRLSEATGHGASTVHRLLELTPGEDSGRREDKTLSVDLLVCDEASMLDVHLALALLRAIPAGATVVFVGDVDQLPSVGPGRVLADLIDSGRLPVTRLRDIFRQAEGSGIIENAHRILAGEVPRGAPRGAGAAKDDASLGDFYWIDAEDPAHARDLVVRLVTERIPQRFGFDPRADVQVLTPMHRGEVGTEELNRALQAALNPPPAATSADAPVLKSRGRSFSVGDKVMQIKNDYERDVWNGDVGRVTHVDAEEGTLKVAFDDEREAIYDGDTLEQLELAYAVSVHKSQGSEYKAVVVPLVLQHYPLLRRNLLYTAVTRGKKLVVLVGSPRALRRAVTESGDQERYTRLSARLRHILPT